MSLPERLVSLGATGAILGAATLLGGNLESNGKPELHPYSDIGGVKTWCYGETVGTPKPSYTVQECDAQLVKSVRRYWTGIKQYVPEQTPTSVKEAMVSVAYNVGVSGWAWNRKGVPSPFVQALKAHQWQAACDAITAPWHGKEGVSLGYKATVQGWPSTGLENRRAKEYKVCIRDLQ